MKYPETRQVDAVDELAGVRFPDPYRWLEDQTDEVQRWQQAQNALASSYARDWPHWEALRELVERYTVARFGAVPSFAGGRWFRSETPEGASHPVVVVSDEPFGSGRTLVDLAAYRSGDAHPYLSWISPSPDGRILALGVCTDGSEQNTIRLVDVESGDLLPAPPQVLHDAWTAGAAWLPDSSGFYFYALASSVHDFDQRIFRYTLGGAVVEEDIPGVVRGHEYSLVQISPDGRWAVAVHRLTSPLPVAVRDLSDPGSGWRPFVTGVDGTVAGHVIGGRYIAVTDVGADRGRLVAIPLDAAHPSDPSTWIELVPESDAVIRTVTTVGDHVYLSEFVDTYARVRIVDADGSELGVVPLPGQGALHELPFPMMMLPPRGRHDEFVFAFSTLTSSWGVYRHRPGDEQVEELQAPDVVLDATVEDRWATSLDGTRIPYHVVRPRGAEADAPQPTLLHAYGAFNVPLVPQYPSPMGTFVAAGGVFVHAHIRGGAEFGRHWWEGGRKANKQNCYDDLFAVAEDLLAQGLTTIPQLALMGGSNGGLLCGNAVVQRPDLWRVVVPRVPIIDLIGRISDPYGAWAIREYGDPDTPDGARRLAAISPNRAAGEAAYPSVFVDAGDTDPRCPPWHARKLAARLQAMQLGDAPILLHVWENVGHGWATERSIALDQSTEWLAFTLKELGMPLRSA